VRASGSRWATTTSQPCGLTTSGSGSTPLTLPLWQAKLEVGVLRVGGEWDQRPGPLGDSRTLADCCSPNSVPAPTPSAPAAPPAKTPAEPTEYLSIAAAAQYLGCSKGLVRKLLTAPDPMPSVTLGRARRIPRAALDTWVARRMVAPPGVDDVLAELRGRR
jgi:excisionase family DNA binding protein